jgi:hypothetical protein
MLPYHIPGVDIEIEGGLGFKATNVYLQQFQFTSANIQLLQANTVYFTLSSLTAGLALNWELHDGGNSTTGVATLNLTNCQGFITAYIQPDYFQNVNASFVVGDLVFKTTDQSFIEPYWELFKPVVVDVLEREIPNILLEINTKEIKSLVYPIVQSVEPVHIPDQNMTVGLIYGAITNMILTGIDFEAATMGRGVNDNEVVFELIQVSAVIDNDWEFKALGIDDKGDGNITITSTTISVTVGIGQDNLGEFTVNLDNAKINIGSLTIHLDGGGSDILNFLIQYITPLVVDAIQNTFQLVVCILFNGIPSS